MVVMLVTYIAGVVLLSRFTEAGGYPLGGRYLQPSFTAFPLLWGEVILLNRHRLGAWLHRGVPSVCAVVVAVVNGAALLANGRRYSVGTDGPWSYLVGGGGGWSPRGGWLLWAAFTVTGMVVLTAGFIAHSKQRSAAPTIA